MAHCLDVLFRVMRMKQLVVTERPLRRRLQPELKVLKIRGASLLKKVSADDISASILALTA